MGMVSIQDTGDVRIRAASVERNSGSDEALSAIYVDGLEVTDSTFSNAASDALDIEFSVAHLARLRIVDPGDECIDLMDSTVGIIDSECVGWGGNAISAGQGSRVDVSGFRATAGNVGMLIKDASHVDFDKVVCSRCRAEVDIAAEDGAYPGRNRLRHVPALQIRDGRAHVPDIPEGGVR